MPFRYVAACVHCFHVARPCFPGEGLRQFDERESSMGVPRRFAIPNDCLSCALRRTCDFCNLPQPLMSEFNAMGHLTLYPSNATLLAEGQIPRGVYIACSGPL